MTAAPAGPLSALGGASAFRQTKPAGFPVASTEVTDGYVRWVASAETAPVLVTGSTGRIGRMVVDELLADGVPVRALTRRPEGGTFPSQVDVVGGDFTAPERSTERFRASARYSWCGRCP